MFLATISNRRIGAQEIIVRNISKRGIGARSKGVILAEGEAVTLQLGPVGDVEGTVRWIKGSSFGVELVETLDPELFNFEGKSWDVADKRFDGTDVYRAIKPIGRARRPGLKTR